MSALPLQRDRRRVRFTLTHDQRRVAAHHFGYADPQRLELARLGPFAGIFGNPAAVLRQMPRYTARIIKFPGRRSDIAKLRAESRR